MTSHPQVLTIAHLAMWTDLVAALPVVATLHPPASEAALRDAAEALGHPLPEELVALLRESDGVEGEYGLGLIWPVERIVADNRALRDDPALMQFYMPFDPLLFFGDAGNGDQFALVPMTTRPLHASLICSVSTMPLTTDIRTHGGAGEAGEMPVRLRQQSFVRGCPMLRCWRIRKPPEPRPS